MTTAPIEQEPTLNRLSPEQIELSRLYELQGVAFLHEEGKINVETRNQLEAEIASPTWTPEPRRPGSLNLFLTTVPDIVRQQYEASGLSREALDACVAFDVFVWDKYNVKPKDILMAIIFGQGHVDKCNEGTPDISFD